MVDTSNFVGNPLENEMNKILRLCTEDGQAKVSTEIFALLFTFFARLYFLFLSSLRFFRFVRTSRPISKKASISHQINPREPFLAPRSVLLTARVLTSQCSRTKWSFLSHHDSANDLNFLNFDLTLPTLLWKNFIFVGLLAIS